MNEHPDAIRALVARHRVRPLFLVGSAAAGEFEPASSGVNFRVALGAGQERGLGGACAPVRATLGARLDRPADLVEAHIPKKPYFIESINRAKRLLDAARRIQGDSSR